MTCFKLETVTKPSPKALMFNRFGKIICPSIKGQWPTGHILIEPDKSTTEKPFEHVFACCLCVCVWEKDSYILRIRIRPKIHQDFGHLNIFLSAADMKCRVAIRLETQLNYQNANQIHSCWDAKLLYKYYIYDTKIL